ncbi:MAG: NAD-dependent epimerase/dehydratase family protein [Weeksellaceae bacterium]|nr:NAD-dependent epimerase/dehydratase family protein [Weeksellaceae bacterium]
MRKILITGSLGQIGTELVKALSAKFGADNVIASDIRERNNAFPENQYEQLDVMDYEKFEKIVIDNNVGEIYHLAALLSATAEKHPLMGWDLNTKTLIFILELAKAGKIDKIFWPSSIAVFGRGAHKMMTGQEDVRNPLTMYGVAKMAGENLCEYYFTKFGVDVRSIRYPGLISHSAPAGGGTTDYAVEIFHHALDKNAYTSYIDKHTYMPMLYMDDAIAGTLKLMYTEVDKVSVRTSYNLGCMSFNPEELAAAIQRVRPDFQISYAPDFRQQIAESWPHSIDDTVARKDWGWQPQFTLNRMVEDMLMHLSSRSELA